MACGFTQVAGQDYDETYSLVAKPVSIHILMAIVTHHDLECKQYNIITAFLQAKLTDCTIYVEQRYGFKHEGKGNKVCLLLRAPYRLKQSLLL